MKNKIILLSLSLLICANICAMKPNMRTKRLKQQKAKIEKIIKKAQKFIKQNKLQKAKKILLPVAESDKYVHLKEQYEAELILAEIYEQQIANEIQREKSIYEQLIPVHEGQTAETYEELIEEEIKKREKKLQEKIKELSDSYLKHLDNIASQNINILCKAKAILKKIIKYSHLEYKKAIEQYQEFLQISEQKKLNNPEMQLLKCNAMLNISGSYHQLKKYKKTIDICFKLLAIIEKEKSNNPKMQILKYRAMYNIASSYLKLKKYNKAKEMFRTLSRTITKERQNDPEIRMLKYQAICCRALSHEKLKESKKAKKYYEQAKKYYEQNLKNNSEDVYFQEMDLEVKFKLASKKITKNKQERLKNIKNVLHSVEVEEKCCCETCEICEEERSQLREKYSEEINTLQKKHTCVFCKKQAICKKCSQCRNAYYCSRECQKKDWKKHKKNCNKK